MPDGKTKEALARSDERLRLAKRAAGIGVYDFDVETRALEWDARIRELWGVADDEPVTYELYLRGIHDEDRPGVQGAIERALDPRGDGEIALVHRVTNGRDGVTRFIAARGQVSFAGGRARRLVGTVQDVTATMNAEAQLRVAAEGNAKFRVMFEQGAQFAAILSLDGAVLEANGLFLEGCGLPRQDVIGKPFWECGWWSRSPETRAMIQVAVAGAAAGGISRRESACFVADGTKRFVDLIIAPVTNDDGQTVFVVATGNDVTERHAAQERLRFLDALSEATRAASDPSEILAATTRMLGTHLNATRCVYADIHDERYSIPHDWTEEGATSSIGTYELARLGPRLAAALRAGRTVVISDVDLELPDVETGRLYRDIGVKSFICCPLVKDRRLVAFMAVNQRATRKWTDDEVSLLEEVVDRSWAHIERARDAETLRDQDRRKDEFLAVLAHELRNPLAPIRTGIDLLKIADGKLADKTLGVMERQVSHMVRLIDDLLDVSRVSLGKLELRRDRLPVRALVDAALETSRPLIDNRSQRLTISVPDEPLWIDGDLTRLAQVVGNLLNNSAKYSDEGGRIDLRVAADGANVIIEVTDDGAGISPEVLPRVFDIFTQAKSTIDDAQGGLGIGLALVEKLVEMHGGSVHASSAGRGQGSTFTIRLPVAKAPAAHAAPRTEARARANARRVLIVDDNLDGAEMLSAMLSLRSHETEIASDGPSALSAARRISPDIVFLDIGLPGMNGFEVARLLRADVGFRGTLVALTGWGGAEDRRRTKEAGFDFHLTKPVGLAEVESLLADTLVPRP